MGMSGNPDQWTPMTSAPEQYPAPDLREMIDITPKPAEPTIPSEMKNYTIGSKIKYTPEIVTYSDGEPIDGTLVGICAVGGKLRVALANGKEILVDADRVA